MKFKSNAFGLTETGPAKGPRFFYGVPLAYQGSNWTTVDRFFHPTTAHIAAGKLESEGIPVFLLGINHASANWLLSNALGGIRLQVPAGFADDARELLAEIANSDGGSEPAGLVRDERLHSGVFLYEKQS